MKKFLAAVAVAMCSLTASAQVWVGGSVGFAVTNPEGPASSTTVTSIAPQIGYKLSEKWEIGLLLEETAIFSNENVNAFYLSPFGRYNFAKAGIANFFLDGGVLVGTQNFADNYVKSESHTSFGLGFRPGVKIGLSEHLGLEAKTGYLGVLVVTDVATQFGLGVNGEALSLGLIYEF